MHTPLRWRLAVAALVVSGVAYLTWTFLPPGLRIGDPTLVSDIAFLPGSFLVALLAWHASSARDISSGARRGWRWIAISYVFFWLGDALWLVYEVILAMEPSPSLADVAYLAYYPALVIGLLSFPRVIRSPIERARFGLDAATIVLGGVMVAWFFVIGPVASAEHANPLDAFLSAAYPVGDLVILFGVVIVALRAPRDVPRAAVVALLSGLVAYLAADTIYGVQALNDTYAGGGFVDALSVSAWTLTGIGAYLAATRRDAVSELEARSTDGVPLVPYLAVAIGYAMLLAALSHDWTPAIVGLVAGAGGLTALVMARQLLAVKENIRLVGEEEARRAEARLRSLVENASDLILVTDAERNVIYATPSVGRTLGFTAEQVAGRPIEGLVHPEDVSMARGLMDDVQGTGLGSPTYQLRLIRSDGTPLSVELSVLDLLDDPEMRSLVITIRDIDRRNRLELKLARQAHHDALTGLPGSPLFMGNVAHALTQAEHSDADVALIYVGMDNFREINLWLGHAGGDAMLVEAATRIRRSVRPNDIVGRVGGDEFAVLIDQPVTLAAAESLAERILVDVRGLHTVNGQPALLSASIGLVVCPAAGMLPDDLMRTAEAAMHAAKRQGRDRWIRMDAPAAA